MDIGAGGLADRPRNGRVGTIYSFRRATQKLTNKSSKIAAMEGDELACQTPHVLDQVYAPSVYVPRSRAPESTAYSVQHLGIEF